MFRSPPFISRSRLQEGGGEFRTPEQRRRSSESGLTTLSTAPPACIAARALRAVRRNAADPPLAGACVPEHEGVGELWATGMPIYSYFYLDFIFTLYSSFFLFSFFFFLFYLCFGLLLLCA
jgi:hypothetical protein